jgi:hypothetical protein
MRLELPHRLPSVASMCIFGMIAEMLGACNLQVTDLERETGEHLGMIAGRATITWRASRASLIHYCYYFTGSISKVSPSPRPRHHALKAAAGPLVAFVDKSMAKMAVKFLLEH